MRCRSHDLVCLLALSFPTLSCSESAAPAPELTGGTSGAAGGAASGAGGGSAGNGTPATGGVSAAGGNVATGGQATGGAASASGGASVGGSSTATGGAASGSGGAAIGGASGSGTAGTAGTAAGGAGPLTACPPDVLFCDDFESYGDMAPPSGQWKTWTVGNAKLVVDSAQAFSGSKAAHFHGKVSQSGGSKEQAFMLAEGAPAFPVTGSKFYLRFMMYGTRFPFTGVTDSNHISLAWIGSSKALNSPDRGATNEGYMLADYNGISIEPMWSGYFRDTSKHFKDANQANSWHCWEVLIDNAGGPPPSSTGVALPHIWEDGVELKLSPAGGTAEYAAIPFEALMFALWSPQTDVAASDYWIDDVAVSKSRINCPPKK